ncbi:MAG: flagellar basal body-associated FliL family protein [Lachnospiraceae bacterium]|nr:flagellar basal body-associated FliL family protein [Lachnospiraceae bacterium]
MKKNLISILILALMVVNVVLTAIMMFSVTGTAKKTNALVSNIASVLNIELSESEEEGEEGVSIADSEAVDIGDTLTIPLKKGDDGKDHFYLVDVTLYMNKKHEDYETFNPTVTSSISLFKSIIIEVISSHTLEEAQSNPEQMRNEILSRIQSEYNSTFIYKVTFSNIMYQ